MKKIFRISFLLLISLSLNIEAQIVNVNPNPNGEPWIAGDAIPASPEKDATIPVMTLSPISQQVPLAPAVDNSAEIWMPPVFNQGTTGACVQVAEIWYTFGYEINRLRNLSAGEEIGDEQWNNQYHPFYTYNFLNGGNYQSTTIYKSGFDLIKENGCPSYETFNDPKLSQWYSISCIYWMHGYEKYFSGMHNTISGYEIINWGNSYASLEPLKHWIADHNHGDQTGGLAIIAVFSDGWNPYSTFPLGSPEYGEHYISQWGTSGGHALTIVGYNDNVHCFNLDGDGEYTNEDRDGDGVIELSECEKGAFKVVNSWGTDDFGDGGYIYVPYKLMGAGLQVPNQAYYCLVEEGDESIITVRTNFEHPVRSRVSFSVGYAQTANDPNPLGDIDDYKFICFDGKGGSNSMRGVYSGPIEVEMNHSYFHDPDAVGKVFFSVVESGDAGNTNTGIIHSFSLVDHRWGEDFELPCTQTDVYIANNSTTTLSINYHLLPHEEPITSDLIVNSDRVSRFTTTVPTGKVFRVATNTNIDMYNSEIHIEAGGNLILNGNNTITAKRGTCKLVIDGSISVGSSVYFTAEEGAVLEIYLNNNNQAITFSGTHFTGCRIYSAAQSLSFATAVLTNCEAVNVSRGDVTAQSTEFYNSYLKINYPDDNNQFVTTVMNNCSFVATTTMPAIFMTHVKNYLIQGNTMEDCSYGVMMFYCGNGQTGHQEISGNTITGSLMAGIKAYNTTGTIDGLNNINHNNFGITLFNNSTVEISGNKHAMQNSQTQQILNNTSYEVYATNCSFPTNFHYNAIIDNSYNGNPSGPLIFYDRSFSLPYEFVDISLNCWGSSFNPTQYLIINNGEFDWTPSWCPGGGIPTIDAAEDMYLLAESQADCGNYSQAKSTLQLLIEQHPESEYARAAMKELLRLEAYSSTDYDALKDYFLTSSTISADTVLTKLGKFLSNKCDIKLERWQDAITWYEQQIQNPYSVEDSIFAIIDLEDLYLQMESLGLKSAFACNLPQYIPENGEKYFGYRDYLLSLFPFEKDQNHSDPDITGNNNQGFLSQNSPNPFSESTQINYSITRAGNVDISVRNLTGQEIISLPQGTQEKGSYSVGFVNQTLPSGFYFFSLKIDGNVIATRKMCVSR